MKDDLHSFSGKNENQKTARPPPRKKERTVDSSVLLLLFRPPKRISPSTPTYPVLYCTTYCTAHLILVASLTLYSDHKKFHLENILCESSHQVRQTEYYIAVVYLINLVSVITNELCAESSPVVRDLTYFSHLTI
jgi:hypothetical protein